MHSLCSGIPPLPHPFGFLLFFFPFSLISYVKSPWHGDPWLGCRVVPATGALFNLGAGRQKWNPLDIPGTQPPLNKKVVNGSENCSKGEKEVQVATVSRFNNLTNMFNQKFAIIRSHIYFVQLSNKPNAESKTVIHGNYAFVYRLIKKTNNIDYSCWKFAKWCTLHTKVLSPYTVTKYKVILCAVPNYTIPLLIFPKCKLENSVKVPEEDKIAKLEESSVCQKKKTEGKKTHL